MEAKNFRIGNWVYDKTFKKEIQFNSFYGLCNIEKNINNYRPILLTKDWLVKFGCWNTTLNERLFFCGILTLYLEGDGDITIRRKQGVDTYYLTTIKYVHQLQNLFFAITGEELKLTHEKSAEL